MSQNNNSIGLNELVDYQKKTYTPFMEKVMKFLWKCAGADPQILQYSPYSDHIKNAGIGGVVLATTVMATMAMGFAMHTIFASPVPGMIDPITGTEELSGRWVITIPIAVIWGLIIFNLDRFIVSTVKGDGTEKITKEEFWAMLPRLVMAIIIGLTISAPLETYIFKREIDREWKLSMDKLAQSKSYDIAQFEKKNDEEKVALYNTIKEQVTRQQAVYEESKKEFNKEMNGESGRGGYGKESATKEKDKNKELSILDGLNLKLDSLEKGMAINKAGIKIKQDSARAYLLKEHPGFLDQLMMLEKLSSHGKEVEKINAVTGEVEKKKDTETGEMVAVKEPIYDSAFWPIWLVRLLFMIVEIAPVIFKFMIWKSSYDYMQDNVAQILEAKQGISLEVITDENNNLHKVKENYNARRIVEVSKRQNELEKENAIHAITLFAEKEREAIENDPAKFIKSETNLSKLTDNEQTEKV
jgi:hypothetical protein